MTFVFNRISAQSAARMTRLPEFVIIFSLLVFFEQSYAMKEKRLWRDPSIDWLWNSAESDEHETFSFETSRTSHRHLKIHDYLKITLYGLHESMKILCRDFLLPFRLDFSSRWHPKAYVWWKIDLLIFVFIEFLRKESWNALQAGVYF